MARINNLTNFLNDVSSAIKQKIGDNTPIPASEFDTEILNIETKGEYQQKTVNITSNGTQIFTPDTGYDAVDQLTVITNVPMQSLQSKSVQITSNGNISVLPDTGYQGMTQVDLTVNVPQGGGSGDVKLFETIAEMQADPNPSEGDLAVVYKNDIVSPSPGDTINSFSPPATVVFDTAIISSVYMTLSGEGMIMLDCELTTTSCTITDMFSLVIPDAITYTSSDGLIYTRTDGGAETYDLGEDITIPSNANTNILKFFQSGETIFEGLYGYNSTDNEYKIISAQLDATTDYVYEKTFYGRNGIVEGTLTEMVSNSFTDVNAEVYSKIQRQYDTMVPIVVTNSYNVDKNIYVIPTNANGEVLLDTSGVTSMYNKFSSCKNLMFIPLLDTSNVTSTSNMFSYCENLETISQLNTSKVTNMSSMFQSCYNLTTIPLLDTSNVTNMSYMFSDCSSLTNVPQLNTSSVTNMIYMFQRCESLTTIPLLNTSSVTRMDYMFTGCTSLTTIPLLDISNVTNTQQMFMGCLSLTTVPQLNISSVTKVTGMFSGCTSLSNTSLNNILAMCAGATSYTGTKKLSTLGLTSAQATTCQGLSNYSAFTSAGWTTGY